MPAASWPRSIGVGRIRLPSTTERSEWQTPATSMRTRISPGPGASNCSLLIDRGADAANGGSAPLRSSTAPTISIDAFCSTDPGQETDRAVCSLRGCRWSSSAPSARIETGAGLDTVAGAPYSTSSCQAATVSRSGTVSTR